MVNLHGYHRLRFRGTNTPEAATTDSRRSKSWQEAERNRREQKKKRKPKPVTGHVPLPENKVISDRKPGHPAGHERSGWWPGLRTTGTAPKRPGEDETEAPL